MSSYTISPTLNKSRVFILQKSELEKRFDPQFYKQEYKDNLEKIKRINHKRLGEVVRFSTETWNQKDFFDSTFPYIEISEIDTISGEIQNIVQVEKEKAASRAKMIVRENDIIISTTRPNRGAISLIRKEQDFSIASTGFSVIRNITNPEIDREYLFTILRQQIILKQFEQRSSGGNYPAITQEELCSVTIPLPEKEIQKKIVKVFNCCFAQKQKNEAEAENLLSSIDDYLLKELGIKLPEPKTALKDRIFKSTLSKVSGNRFDCDYYFNEEIEISIKGGIYKTVGFSSLLTSLINGYDFRDYKEFGTPYIKVANVRKGNFDFSKMQYIEKDTSEISKAIQLKKGNILLTRKGTYGYSLCIEEDLDYVISSEIFYIELKHELINSNFLEMFFNSIVGQKQFERVKIGAIMGSLSQEAVKSLRIPLPPLDKQKEISEHITDIRQQAQQLKDKSNELLKKASEEIEEILLN